ACCQSASEAETTSSPRAFPTLFTNTSMRPNRSSVRRTTSSAPAFVDTSACTARTASRRPARLVSSADAVWSASAPRAQIATRAIRPHLLPFGSERLDEDLLTPTDERRHLENILVAIQFDTAHVRRALGHYEIELLLERFAFIRLAVQATAANRATAEGQQEP